MGGQSRDTASGESAKAQNALDFTLPVEITNIIADSESCSSNGLATFTIFYNPLGEGGKYEIVVKDYTGSTIPIYGDANLPSSSYQSTKVIDLSSKPDVKCTDTFRAYIKNTKNGQEILSNPKSFFWPVDAGIVATFNSINPTSGTYFDSPPELTFEVNINGYQGDNIFEWYLESEPQHISKCDNKLKCEISIPTGVHRVNFKAYKTSTDEDPIIDQRTPEMYICNNDTCNFSVDNFSTLSGNTKFIQNSDITLVTDVSSDLDPDADYICDYYNETNNEPLGSNNCEDFTINTKYINSGTLGSYKLKVNVVEDNIKKSNSRAINIQIIEGIPPLKVEIIDPKENNNYNVGEKVNFSTEINGGVAPYSCVWEDSGNVFNKNDCSKFSYTFTKPGNKSIVLNVIDSEENQLKTKERHIEIIEEQIFIDIISPKDGDKLPLAKPIEFITKIEGHYPPFNCIWFLEGQKPFSNTCTEFGYAFENDPGAYNLILHVEDKASNVVDKVIEIELFS
jgi:hypothetical protein